MVSPALLTGASIAPAAAIAASTDACASSAPASAGSDASSDSPNSFTPSTMLVTGSTAVETVIAAASRPVSSAIWLRQPEHPHGPARHPQHQAGLALTRRSLQSRPLLQHDPEREQQRGDQGKDDLEHAARWRLRHERKTAPRRARRSGTVDGALIARAARARVCSAADALAVPRPGRRSRVARMQRPAPER
jgi:hypothetical protein